MHALAEANAVGTGFALVLAGMVILTAYFALQTIYMRRQLRKRDEQSRRLQVTAYIDPLTELPNRRVFEDRLSHALEMSERRRTAEAYVQRWPVTPVELDVLRQPIRQLVGKELALPPGTRFGPLIGTAHGEFGDFAWVPIATLLVRRESLSQLRAAGVGSLNAANTQLIYDTVPAPDLVELEIPLIAELDQSSYAHSEEKTITRCGVCGRISHGTYLRTVVNGGSMTADLDLLRPRNHPTIILATERFCRTVHELGLKGLRCEEVEMV